MIIFLISVVVLGGWLGWVYWDSRRTWLDESARFDSAMREHDQMAAAALDAAEVYQRRMAEREQHY